MVPSISSVPSIPKKLSKKEYNVHRHTKTLAFEARLIKTVSREDRLMYLVPGRVVYDFKNNPDMK